ncbi:hypothetical protein [Paraflavitalea pollutisoli]|uniref:hypothetical protein n=1 Tax=Paraflavitalea pollutisoli TaxID=3034143 RepID=UPI0023EBD3AE|nr:hypothetical protein [Paraflavitalea sp. H1-2-19X]
MIKKVLTPTLDKINSLFSRKDLILDVDHYLLKDYPIVVEKEKSEFSIKLNYKPYKGFNSSQLHTIELPQPIRLYNDTETYFIPDNSIRLNQQYFDFDESHSTVRISGSLTRLSTSELKASWEQKYLRFIIPLTRAVPEMRNIRGFTFDADMLLKGKQLIKLKINDCNIHFITFTIDGDSYIAIDTVERYSQPDFDKICHAIVIGFGFLYGNVYLDEGCILSSNDENFEVVENIRYSTYRESIVTGYRIHTTNPYSVMNLTGVTEEEIDRRQQEAQGWTNEIIEIESEFFSKLCEYLANNEPISRAALITLQGNMLSLELKGSAYSTALEAMTDVIMEEFKVNRPKPISKADFKKLRDELIKILDQYLPATSENETARKIFTIRINDLNSPTNTSKLQKAFELVGYTLNSYEMDCLNARNKFQHGLLPISDSSDDAAFKEIYFICIVMHRLIYTLILHKIGFKGYIINYPQIHNGITKRDLNEKEFYGINK